MGGDALDGSREIIEARRGVRENHLLPPKSGYRAYTRLKLETWIRLRVALERRRRRRRCDTIYAPISEFLTNWLKRTLAHDLDDFAVYWACAANQLPALSFGHRLFQGLEVRRIIRFDGVKRKS